MNIIIDILTQLTWFYGKYYDTFLRQVIYLGNKMMEIEKYVLSTF